MLSINRLIDVVPPVFICREDDVDPSARIFACNLPVASAFSGDQLRYPRLRLLSLVS